MNKPYIVLVDNDPSNLEFLENLIYEIRPKSQCVSFIFGDEAIDALCHQFRQVPEFVFINANLKRTSGSRCLSMLRSDGRFNDCCIGIFSLCMPEALADTYKLMGADFAFQRPISLPEGQVILEDIFTTARKHKSGHRVA
ncbi:hypothetical protein WBG78_07510 [Chryseolinea sp. T2]|uniref:hypothetical protein n=1 Tax=Chryseolinea sp. T2 TaxID=3129255 RepID=UPI00307856C1